MKRERLHDQVLAPRSSVDNHAPQSEQSVSALSVKTLAGARGIESRLRPASKSLVFSRPRPRRENVAKPGYLRVSAQSGRALLLIIIGTRRERQTLERELLID